MPLTYFEILAVNLKDYEKVYNNFDNKQLVEEYIKNLDTRLKYFLNRIMISKNVSNNVEGLMKEYLKAYTILKSKSKSMEYYNKLDSKTKLYINETNRLFNNSINSFNNLRKYIGKEVTVTFIDSMGTYDISEKLVDVTDFETIIISSIRYPFISKNRAIKKIEDNNEVIYINNSIKDKYDINTPLDLYNAKANMYGRSIAARDASIEKSREDQFINDIIFRDIKKELKDNYLNSNKGEFEKYVEEDVKTAYAYYKTIKYLELLKKELINDKEIFKEIKGMQVPVEMKNDIYKLTKKFDIK